MDAVGVAPGDGGGAADRFGASVGEAFADNCSAVRVGLGGGESVGAVGVGGGFRGAHGAGGGGGDGAAQEIGDGLLDDTAVNPRCGGGDGGGGEAVDGGVVVGAGGDAGPGGGGDGDGPFEGVPEVLGQRAVAGALAFDAAAGVRRDLVVRGVIVVNPFDRAAECIKASVVVCIRGP